MKGPRIAITLPAPALRLLRLLHGTGLHGSTIEDVARELLLSGLRKEFLTAAAELPAKAPRFSKPR